MLHRNNRQYINSIDDLEDELKLKWHNMILFASKEVIIAVHSFIKNPSQINYQRVALAMRDDLWGGKVSVKQLKELNF